MIKGKMKSFLPILSWLPQYQSGNIKWDLIAGVTLASFVLPESMAYATLAGVPTYFGIYCCLAGGLFFAFLTTSKHVAVGPTSSISLMIGSTLAVLSGGDPARWADIAALTTLVVAGICLIAFFLRLSSIVNFISDSILLGFKAGAAFSIMSTQLHKLFGVESGGTNFFTRLGSLFEHLPEINWVVFAFGGVGIILMVAGDKLFPGKPVSLFVVIGSILVMTYSGLSAYGIHIAGVIPKGLPHIGRSTLRISDVDGVLELAFACFLMGYIETVSAARTFALKNNYSVNPRQELLSLFAANFASAFSSGYVVSGGLSQTTVNEKSGAKTPLSIIICSIALGIILLFLTGFLKNLPEVILAAIVLHAVTGLIKVKELKNIYQLSKLEFGVAMIALVGVLVFGILKGVMLAVIMSLILMIRRTAYPNVAVLGRIGNTPVYSDVVRHPDNIVLPQVLIIRIEASILYFNEVFVKERIDEKILAKGKSLHLIILDLSSVPMVDVAGAKMLSRLFEETNGKGLELKIVDALSTARDILRKIGLEDKIGHISRKSSIDAEVQKWISLHPDAE